MVAMHPRLREKDRPWLVWMFIDQVCLTKNAPEVSAAPEPATWAFIIAGLGSKPNRGLRSPGETCFRRSEERRRR